MKKLAGLLGAGALVLGMAVPTFAQIPVFDFGSDVMGNFASVKTNTFTVADSGDNKIIGAVVKGGFVWTGKAQAVTSVSNMVNSMQTSCGTCFSTPDVERNFATVSVNATTIADSGDNMVSGMMVGGGKIFTGFANAGTGVTNIVNSFVGTTVTVEQ